MILVFGVRSAGAVVLYISYNGIERKQMEKFGASITYLVQIGNSPFDERTLILETSRF